MGGPVGHHVVVPQGLLLLLLPSGKVPKLDGVIRSAADQHAVVKGQTVDPIVVRRQRIYTVRVN